MTYDVLMRRSIPVSNGDGNEHRLQYRHIEAMTEEGAYLKVRKSPSDAIACIDSWRHMGMFPFSVDIGNPEFYTDVVRPSIERAGSEPRVG